jgi:hypothetical protein
MRLRFSIRQVLWLTLIVAIAAGWFVDHRRLTGTTAPTPAVTTAAPVNRNPHNETVMQDSDFLNNSADRPAITKTCDYLERASHKLQLMSVRKNMTVTEMLAQIGVIKTWLADLESALNGKTRSEAREAEGGNAA